MNDEKLIKNLIEKGVCANCLNSVCKIVKQAKKEMFDDIEKEIDKRVYSLKQIKRVKKPERLLIEEKIKTLEGVKDIIEEKRHLSTFDKSKEHNSDFKATPSASPKDCSIEDVKAVIFNAHIKDEDAMKILRRKLI